MPQDKFSKLAKFFQRKIRSKSSLQTFFTFDTNSNISFNDHSNIVSTITDACDSFSSSIMFKLLCHFGLLRGGASADTNTRSLNGDGEECIRSLLVVENHIQGFSIDYNRSIFHIFSQFLHLRNYFILLG